MCGIAGAFAYRDAAPPIDEAELLRMREHMKSRGPDGSGLWISDDRRVGLAHRRLAIIDLSDAGAQPMWNAPRSLCITYNGEIYNYRELRKELEGRGCVFRSQSDTEVLLQLYEAHGTSMLERLRGMFAFAILDARAQSLFLARDPFGIKPLYYADDGHTLRFASQVKALVAGGGVDTAPEPAGSAGFLLWGCVPEPFTLYRGIVGLPAGTHLTVRRREKPKRVRYFEVRDELLCAQAEARPFRMQDREALAEMLRDSVERHLVADVPVGAFLSAGVDSTLISSLAAPKLREPLRTLTLGFEAYRSGMQDEAPLAEKTAAAIGARHRTHRVAREDFEQDVDQILAAMDQPSTDGVNAWLICREAARDGLKVALSGLGGDELFGGYPSFRDVPRIARWLRPAAWAPFIGRLARGLLAPAMRAFTSPKYAGLLEYGGSWAGAYLLRRALFMPWELKEVLDPVALHVGLERLQTRSRLAALCAGLRTTHAKVCTLELSWYMRNQLLRDADWAGMAHSIEVRLPYVDRALFRALAPWLVSARPPAKEDAAAAAKSPTISDVLERRKSGFSVPVREWKQARARQRRGLRGWAEDILPPQPRLFRALVLVTDAYGGIGGIAKFDRDLIAALAAMPDCAEIVVVQRLGIASAESIPPHARLVGDAVPAKSRFVMRALAESARGPYGAIVCAHINLLPLAILAAAVRRTKCALAIYGIDAWTPHTNPMVRAMVNRIDACWSISDTTTKRFAQWAKVKKERFRLLPPAVELSEFGPGSKPSALVKALALENRKVLLTVGRLVSEERYKGFDEVLEALPALARERPDITYLICGDGTDRARLEAKAAALGVSERVRFAGYVDETRKADYYRVADAYVMPSRGEGFGIVFLEALACGIPVLGSRADGSREALLDGALGELVDPADTEDVRRGILRTLERPRRVPVALDQFSEARFRARVAGMMRELLERTDRAIQ